MKQEELEIKLKQRIKMNNRGWGITSLVSAIISIALIVILSINGWSTQGVFVFAFICFLLFFYLFILSIIVFIHSLTFCEYKTINTGLQVLTLYKGLSKIELYLDGEMVDSGINNKFLELNCSLVDGRSVRVTPSKLSLYNVSISSANVTDQEL